VAARMVQTMKHSVFASFKHYAKSQPGQLCAKRKHRKRQANLISDFNATLSVTKLVSNFLQQLRSGFLNKVVEVKEQWLEHR